MFLRQNPELPNAYRHGTVAGFLFLLIVPPELTPLDIQPELGKHSISVQQRIGKTSCHPSMIQTRDLPFSAAEDRHALIADTDAVLSAEAARRSQKAARLFLTASRQMALSMAAVLSRWWHRHDPVQAVFSEHMLTEIELDKTRSIAGILRARLARFPARHRKHYAPANDSRSSP